MKRISALQIFYNNTRKIQNPKNITLTDLPKESPPEIKMKFVKGDAAPHAYNDFYTFPKEY